MNGEKKTNNIENGKRTPPASPRVATYKRPTTLKRNTAPTVSLGKPKVTIRAGVPEKQGAEGTLAAERIQLKAAPKPQTEAPKNEPTEVKKATQTVKTDETAKVKETKEVKEVKEVKEIKEIKEIKSEKPQVRSPKKQFNKPKKKRVKQSISPIAAAIVALVSVALIVGVVIISMYASGHRYLTASFEDNVSATNYTVTFIGKVAPDGTPTSGTLTFSDGKKAKIELDENGVIRVEYSDGSVYEGGFKDLHKNGKGTFTMANGDVYTGEFFYDRMWGEGVYTFANGDVYSGSFKNNLKDGYGEYSFANGNRYEGEFSNNMRNGEGIFTYSDGSTYEGAYVNDKKNDDNAKMTTLYSDGTKDVYVGAYKDDMREGHGTYTFANGDSYTGDFKANYISGHGIYTWASGRTYEGEFLNGAIVKDTTVYP